MKAETAGFTLVELLTTILVIAIVAGVSVPSFARIVERQRVEAAMLRLETDIALARTTALARRQAVVVCPRNTGGKCQPGLDWSGGWAVFVEDALYPGRDGGLIWVQHLIAGRGQAMSVSANRNLLRYREDGTSAGSNLTVSLCLRGQVVMQQIVSNTGRARRHQPEEDMPCPV